jgi:predicted nucleic-acid-binding protein
MRITVDTNVLLRLVMADDDAQCSIATETMRSLIDTGNVVLNRPAVEAGLRVLDAGGDFADGVIAYEGAWLGGETFVSFDREAVSLITGEGRQGRLLAAS